MKEEYDFSKGKRGAVVQPEPKKPAFAGFAISSLPDEPHEIVKVSEPHEPPPCTEVGRYGGDPQFRGPLPVGIDRRAVASRREGCPRLIREESDLPGNPRQFVDQGDVPTFDEKRPVDRAPERGSLSLHFRPFPQFLGAPAVVGVGAFPKRNPFRGGEPAQPRLHRLDLLRPPGKELGELGPFLRCFRMEGEDGPAELDPVLTLQAVGTHGTEITPRSDIVEKYLDDGRITHGFLLGPYRYSSIVAGARGDATALRQRF